MIPGYAQTPAGEIHYRRHGRGRPLVLLHWAPSSGRMYSQLMPPLAAEGFDAIALDLPGYGRSHKPAFAWSIPQLAENLLIAIDSLDIGSLDLLGGHLSASIAVEMALQQPGRIRHLVLDGLLNLRPDEWTSLLAPFAGLSPMPASNPDFKAFPFEIVLRTLREWNPDFELSEATLADVYALLNDYLEMGLGPMRAFVEAESAPPPAPYDLAAQLPRLTRPTLVLSADREPLKAGFERSVAAIPGARSWVFKGTHPLVSGRHQEYAGVVAGFCTG